ncbi:hypothetical protein CARUB_v10015886mg [Capsella rubella]|uniref:KIB1-4 beta-propeller domain-containing protein n=1 Tax=Capsella rubella TaxID=81985 RepID=R0I7Y3_9BRAS|nr:hypothetical protein CARUB_v10015886mg [Capsella rubella]
MSMLLVKKVADVKQKQVTMAEQRIPESIYLSHNIGSSRGWVIRMNNEDLTVHLTNMFNPSAPRSTHKVISLPILLTPYNAPVLSQSMAIAQVCNVSLSSSPDNLDQECIVAVKFWGRSISFCTIEYEFELLRRCTRTKHLVESPSGDTFIIVKYHLLTSKGKPVFRWETQDFDPWEVKTGKSWLMLYMHDPATREETYVQDIGDLCIFLGQNEPFCVPVSMYPGLKPNSIYFTERTQVFLYNIADQTFTRLSHDCQISNHWIQPIVHK